MKTGNRPLIGLRSSAVAALLAALAAPAPAVALTAEEVNSVTFAAYNKAAEAGPDPFIIKAQVLLSRRSVSPGVIDGIDGENFRKAVAQFRRQERLPVLTAEGPGGTRPL